MCTFWVVLPFSTGGGRGAPSCWQGCENLHPAGSPTQTRFVCMSGSKPEAPKDPPPRFLTLLLPTGPFLPFSQ